jgi:hypothetical protein
VKEEANQKRIKIVIQEKTRKNLKEDRERGKIQKSHKKYKK